MRDHTCRERYTMACMHNSTAVQENVCWALEGTIPQKNHNVGTKTGWSNSPTAQTGLRSLLQPEKVGTSPLALKPYFCMHNMLLMNLRAQCSPIYLFEQITDCTCMLPQLFWALTRRFHCHWNVICRLQQKFGLAKCVKGAGQEAEGAN